MNHDVAVLIGRFQPFHEGHLALIASAFERADRLLLLLGSHRCAPDTRNPWSSEERERMIRAALPADWQRRLEVIPIRDHLYSDNLWLAEVQQKVLAVTDEDDRVLLVGHRKDLSSYYLDLFPQWDFQDVPLKNAVHSTAIRQAYFSGGDGQPWASHVPEAVCAFLTEYRETGRYRRLRQEADYIASYRQLWSVAPYPPTFVTTDAVVVQSGHVLVVRRRVRPGQGLIALPGGYLDQQERVVDGMLRELREETGLKVPRPVLEGSIADRHVFDAPGRSQRGRVITHAFLIQLKGGVLPSVRGGDDADKAFWMPLADIYAHEDTFFEDHVQIIQHFISRL
ncbi:bifunctional nicotinamide-nucleotide adenylyltransferase/Nudix hydroxylase [Cyanobium sp. Cruz CV13-4-11]|jgi:bifunctional NMN adenylyltransferase/nudix hydrolase|uniref:bifunctional nicotinamide-nucleotide adenylyltransferase/Nudix hydroxylase n=1 Tax=unclassified Cyanobium TaxID=2627006 RepID=UPI0020CF5C1F|nr:MULTISPECIES: bifunctional nicotinamide-nucleotide adenylyltransferase/Nudix hydroxylase [unclassified Cyanobium]MCP9901049.1 bifunctional nicotinamide-nucleotide adenylyltransferase/Nudix hydroxylase [Cyanobium sp. Cruz CV11-17]MCP9920029.1 bifunctional nicotinamide-nucleotide adenylyltransferase/Nudix hydroxylase [Cyanobium sp. Cruz CV13-4-11]